MIKGRHCEISDRFREHVHEKLRRVDKYDQRKKIIRIDVQVTKERNPRQHDRSSRVELTVRSRGPAIRAEAACEDKMAALDAALDKLEASLRKAVDRRRVHHGLRTPVSVAEATASGERIETLEGALNGHTGRSATAVDDRPVEVRREGPLEVMGEGPLVVREKTHVATPITLDQALYEMEMVGHDFYLFIEKDSGHPSVVYRRRGYDYGVIHLAQEDAVS
ncbi:MAG: ribosome hibernation-promoting factor, HPF/YfiA family [Nocardioidaceae bacterium]